MPLKRKAYDVHEQYKMGFPLVLQMSRQGTLSAAAGTLVSAVRVGSLSELKPNTVALLAGFTAAVTNNGSTGGGTTVRLYRNGTIIGTVTLPYGSGVVSGSVDLRDPRQNGIPVANGDVFAIDISAVPSGGSATDLSVVLYLRAFDVVA